MKVDVQVLKDSIDIVDYIRAYREVEKVNGVEYKCKCLNPAHNDKTPSMFINKDKGVYNCFGCGFKGDIIVLIETIENVDFKEAIKLLIEENGLSYEKVEIEEIKIKDRFDMCKINKAINLYKNENTMSEELIDKYKGTPRYLVDKGFKEETLEHFEVGFCADVNDDMFNRCTIPWRDTDNNLVAINGRDITEESNKKYKFKNNSIKKNIIYNLNNLEKSSKPIIMCEDEKSVWRLYECGFKRAIALGGTSLKDKKWLLRRYTNKVILALDMDESGLEARREIVNEVYHLMDIYAVRLPQDKDFADIRNKDKVNQIVKSKSKYRGG